MGPSLHGLGHCSCRVVNIAQLHQLHHWQRHQCQQRVRFRKQEHIIPAAQWTAMHTGPAQQQHREAHVGVAPLQAGSTVQATGATIAPAGMKFIDAAFACNAKQTPQTTLTMRGTNGQPTTL